MSIKCKGEKMKKDLSKENKSLKVALAQLAHWELEFDRIVKDCQKIVDMYWDIEHRDWEEKDNPEDHIFLSVNYMKNWLENYYHEKRREDAKSNT